MAEVKWIKITTEIFDDEKILLIESKANADSIIVIWFKLLCLAGKQNNSGVFVMSNGMPYTDEMLATIFRRKLDDVRHALKVFAQFGMVEIIDETLTIPNWCKHQTLDQLEERKQYMKNYMQERREKQRQIACKVNSKVNSKVNVNSLEGDKERDKDKELEIDKGNEPKALPSPYDEIKDYFNSVCISYPKIISLSDKRKKSLKGLISTYSLEKVKEVFDKAEKSDFMKGTNDRKWSATFDWIINPTNFLKILEGNYDNKSNNSSSSFDTDEFFKLAVKRGMEKYNG